MSSCLKTVSLCIRIYSSSSFRDVSYLDLSVFDVYGGEDPEREEEEEEAGRDGGGWSE